MQPTLSPAKTECRHALADIICNCECDCRNYLLLSKWHTINNQRLCTGCAVNNHMAAFNIAMPSGKLEVNSLELTRRALN